MVFDRKRLEPREFPWLLFSFFCDEHFWCQVWRTLLYISRDIIYYNESLPVFAQFLWNSKCISSSTSMYTCLRQLLILFTFRKCKRTLINFKSFWYKVFVHSNSWFINKTEILLDFLLIGFCLKHFVRKHEYKYFFFNSHVICHICHLTSKIFVAQNQQ